MKTDRFRLALRELKPSDWERFEQLASIFSGSEYGELATWRRRPEMRVETQYFPILLPSHPWRIQYSVAADLGQQDSAHCQRLKEAFLGQIRILVYAQTSA